jgi:hypothetical protein
MKKVFLSLSLFTYGVYALEMPPMPPMISMKDTNKTVKTETKKGTTKRTTPESCDLIPPMVIFLPPPMEKDVTTCKNELFMPKKDFAAKQLEKLFKKKVKIISIEIVPKFNQLYKITYDGGVILTNKSVDAFIQQ